MNLSPPSLVLALLFGIAGVAADSHASAPAPSAQSDAHRLAAGLLARSDLAAYRGWIKYLLFDAEAAARRDGAGSERALAKARRLDEWARRIAADPLVLSKLRGVQEWAYESPVDGSGQPFKLMIPTDYDPGRPAPVSLYLHGYSGDHLKHSTGMADRAGAFEVAVLGRSRAGGYIGLSGADVLHVVDYLEAHWSIDPACIRLSGGSMGGGGTFKLASRHPHRFACGQVTCGYLAQEPIGNLLTFPIYATHSDDDPVVPINTVRGALGELRRRGGQAVLDETTGFKHAVWDYAAGNRRSAAWAAEQAKAESRNVGHIDFTALDGAAARCWWAEVAEWGPDPKPARFILTAGAANTLFVEMGNVDRLRLRLVESPFDRTRPLRVVVEGRVPFELAAPLPETATITSAGPAPAAEEPAFRLHTPGGPITLYDGSPLLIVYGTGGNEAANRALRSAAEAAARSSNPAWLALDDGEIDRADADRTPHPHLLFGNLPIKADRDVSPADLARCNLVLIGSASENSVVAAIADRLPVRIEGERIVCSDNVAFPAGRRTLGLVHYNPAAPQRQVFWVAATAAEGYAPGATVPRLGARLFTTADLAVTDATDRTLVATRSFDSRWRWVGGRNDSPLVPPAMAGHEALARAVAAAIGRAAGTDFAVASLLQPLGTTALTAGTTRVADLTPLFYHQPVDVLEVSGAELLALSEKLGSLASGNGNWMAFEPSTIASRIAPAKRYRIAIAATAISGFGQVTQSNPRTQWRTQVMVDDAIARFLVGP